MTYTTIYLIILTVSFMTLVYGQYKLAKINKESNKEIIVSINNYNRE